MCVCSEQICFFSTCSLSLCVAAVSVSFLCLLFLGIIDRLSAAGCVGGAKFTTGYGRSAYVCVSVSLSSLVDAIGGTSCKANACLSRPGRLFFLRGKGVGHTRAWIGTATTEYYVPRYY